MPVCMRKNYSASTNVSGVRHFGSVTCFRGGLSRKALPPIWTSVCIHPIGLVVVRFVKREKKTNCRKQTRDLERDTRTWTKKKCYTVIIVYNEIVITFHFAVSYPRPTCRPYNPSDRFDTIWRNARYDRRFSTRQYPE